MRQERKTITEFIIGEQRKSPGATGGFTALLNDIRLACKRIAYRVGKGALADIPLDAMRKVANETFLSTNEWGGHLAAMASEADPEPHPIPDRYPRGRYLLAFDPLCGASALDVNAVAGSLFSVLRAPQPGQGWQDGFLQPGTAQVGSGYAIYGPVTMLVLALETGVNGFTLDREIGEFMLTHPGLRVAEDSTEFAIDNSGARLWEPAVKRYVDECLAGAAGPRGRNYTMRWAASLVADAHRILMRGGVFLSPRTSAEGRHQLLFEANPLGHLIERAGGRASTGDGPLLELVPAALHQRTPLIFGSRNEVERLEQYHRDYNERDYDAPLFGTRGLFRAPAEL